VRLPHRTPTLGAAALLAGLAGLAALAAAWSVTPAAADPGPPATVTAWSLPTLVHVGGPTIPLPVSATLSDPRSSVTFRFYGGGPSERTKTLTLDPAGTRVSGALDPLPAKGWPLGVWSWLVTPSGPSESLSRPALLRLHSLLGLRLTRSGEFVDVTGSARHYDADRDRYVGWAGQPVQVQRWTASGWRTIRTVTTDGRGNVAERIRIPWTVGIRLVDSDVQRVYGATSAQRVR
jgi:hypothetical protein